MNEMLMKVQVGPVQEFIAQARSTRDMWAGSYLLAWMTAAAMKVFKEADCDFIFPTLEKQPLYEMTVTGKGTPAGLIPTLPNVFMLLVPEEQIETLTDQAETALRAELKNVGDTCWKKMKNLSASDDWKNRWDDQLEAFPIFNWSAVPVSNDWKTDIENLGKQMAARRNTREFDPWNGVAGATKDVLSGKEESIGSEEFWKKNETVWKKAGPYGAMNCIKRLFPEAYLKQKFKDPDVFRKEMKVIDTRSLADDEENQGSPYIAVIAMDGDKMGAALKELNTKEEHTAFSKTLAQFAENDIAGMIQDAGGQLVYAGGDDVLAMCPASQALELAEKLAEQFRTQMSNYNLDSSCGIAVGHYQFPLQRIVDEARKAEKRAKNRRGRAAFSLTLLKRSGEIIQWGAKWNSPALGVYADFVRATCESPLHESPLRFSNRFPYALAELLQPYRLSGGVQEKDVDLKKIIGKEFEHVQERQALKKDAKVEGWKNYLDDLDDDCLDDFPTLFLASAFMNRQRGEN